MNECISIIIPAYNAAKYLENCLNSVLCQTYPNIEIMVVDDGSTDNTGEIADRYQEKHPEMLRVIHTQNRGVTAARFEGILASHGEWIGFVDADDEIEPDMYERLYDNAVQNGADISHCGHVTIVNGGERVHKFYNTGRFVKQNGEEGLRDFLEGKFEPGLWNKIYRREIVLEVVQSNEISLSIKFNEDVLMNYYLFKGAKSSVFEDFCGYHYLVRSDSATRKKFRKEKVLDPVRVHRQILKDVSKKKYKPVAIRNYLTACIHAYEALNQQPGCEVKSRKLRKILKKNRDQWYLLRRNDAIKLRLMMASPGLYNRLYQIYVRTIQKKQYE